MSKKSLYETACSYTEVWNSCMIATLAHAMMIPQYPYLAHEHSWDGPNYLLQDSMGTRGTVTCIDNQLVAAFRNDHLMKQVSGESSFFADAPPAIQHIAENETLQYLLLENEKGVVCPSITTAFWITQDILYAHQPWEDMLECGAQLLFQHVMPPHDAIDYWVDAYQMNSTQATLFQHLVSRKLSHPDERITLEPSEIEIICFSEDPEFDGLDLCRAALAQIGIRIP